MTENGAAPAAGGDQASGGTATMQAPVAAPAPAARPQPVHEQVRGEARQGRGPDGKFAPKPDDGPKVMDRGSFREAALAASRRALGKETDAAALDAVKAGSKDPGARTDQGQPQSGTKATAKDGQQDTTGGDPARAKALELAKTHLRLDRWTDAKLARLTDEQILDFGKEAQDEHAAKYREGEERAAAAKAKTQEVAPSKKAGEPDADDAAEYEKLAKEHFKDFDDDGTFSKALAGFGRAAAARHSAALDAHIAKLQADVKADLDDIRRGLFDGLHFETGTRELRDSFPQLASADGRKALATRFEALRKSDQKLDARTALEQAADSLWGAEIRKANAERKERISTARQGAHSYPATMSEAPKPTTFKDVARENVRKHMQ